MGTLVFRTILKLLKKRLESDPNFTKEIFNKETGFVYNARLLFTTEDGAESMTVVFNQGKVEIGNKPILDPTIKLIFKDPKDLAKLYRTSPQDTMVMLLKNKFRYEGCLTDVARFSFLTGLVLQGAKKKFQKRQKNKILTEAVPFEKFTDWNNGAEKIENKILTSKVDNVKHLEDPYLGRLKIQDFKRLNYLRYKHFQTQGTICTERAKLITDFCRKNGFLKEDGNNDSPELRQGKILNYILSNKKPIIHEDDLLAGTTTTKEKGVILFPDLGAVALWPELYTVNNRKLNRYGISQEDIDILNYEVFPFWAERNVREYCRKYRADYHIQSGSYGCSKTVIAEHFKC